MASKALTEAVSNEIQSTNDATRFNMDVSEKGQEGPNKPPK